MDDFDMAKWIKPQIGRQKITLMENHYKNNYYYSSHNSSILRILNRHQQSAFGDLRNSYISPKNNKP